MRILFRILAGIVGLSLASCLLAPWLAYEVALARMGTLPVPPRPLATPQQQAEVWQRAGGEGPLVVEPLNPYGFVLALVGRDRVRPGEEIAYWVARAHLMGQADQGGMLGGQIRSAALTVWLTRHWSAEELATAAHAAARSQASGQRP
ncbi:hypothetical protein [Roseateles sp.]|uniref:hypothetical protein n=1 Tax=Roseateles sp. TaxID=1971397 RepID=UPI002E0168E0|nr:hypothetical protein [Roseateles sp.]